MSRQATAIAASVLALTLLLPAPSAVAAISLVSAANGTFGVTLNGVDQTPTFTFRVRALNPSPYVNTGYHLTISAPMLTGPAGRTIATGAIQSVASVCTAGCGTATANTVGYPLTIPTGAPVTFFSTPANTGQGTYRITPTVRVTVPANARAGTYTTSVTTAIVAGP
jgi:hypothetical protein